MKTYIKREIIRIDKTKECKLLDDIIVEYPLKIKLNGQDLMTIFCTPKSIKQLVVGFLYLEGLIGEVEDISQFDFSEDIASVSLKKGIDLIKKYQRNLVRTTGSGKGISFLYTREDIEPNKIKKSDSMISGADFIFDTMKEFTHKSELFQKTGGVHSVMLKGKHITYFEEDIGRHNAVDKVVGRALIDKVDLNEMILFTSGRVSSEILLKTAIANIPIIASKSAPTQLAVSLADELNITLIGFIRGRRMNIYTNGERIIR